MDRREFLRGATRMLLVMPFATFLLECSSNDEGTVISTSPTEPNPPAAPPRVEGANVVYTSSETNAHSHSFSIPSASLASPPRDGIVGDTTVAQLHSHALTVTAAQLESARSGATVRVETTVAVGHTHTFTIVRVT